MLNNFRTIRRTWDKANTKIHDEIVLSSSDEHGRRIEVQVLDNGQVVDLTGVGLNLYWETKDKQAIGLDNFSASDIQRGIYEIYPTTEMLSNVGQLNAWLFLVTMEGDAITSTELPIRIKRGINTQAPESQDSFSALTDALARLVNIESQEVLRQQQEQDRVDAENARVEAELLREQAEQQRATDFTSSQTARTNAFDQSQLERSNDYSLAEDNRDTLYGQAENARDSLYQQAESTRDSQYAPRLQDLEAKTPGTHEWGVESGENENGRWIKYADGTMICYMTSIDATGADRGNTRRVDFPSVFTDTPNVQLTLVRESTEAEGFSARVYNVGSTGFRFSHDGKYATVAELNYVAIGPWN